MLYRKVRHCQAMYEQTLKVSIQIMAGHFNKEITSVDLPNKFRGHRLLNVFKLTVYIFGYETLNVISYTFLLRPKSNIYKCNSHSVLISSPIHTEYPF